MPKILGKKLFYCEMLQRKVYSKRIQLANSHDKCTV